MMLTIIKARSHGVSPSHPQLRFLPLIREHTHLHTHASTVALVHTHICPTACTHTYTRPSQALVCLCESWGDSQAHPLPDWEKEREKRYLRAKREKVTLDTPGKGLPGQGWGLVPRGPSWETKQVTESASPPLPHKRTGLCRDCYTHTHTHTHTASGPGPILGPPSGSWG